MKKYAVCLLISFLVWTIWSSLELLFYGEIQPRAVDDVIGFVLVGSLYCNYELMSDRSQINELIEMLKREQEENQNDTK